MKCDDICTLLRTDARNGHVRSIVTTRHAILQSKRKLSHVNYVPNAFYNTLYRGGGKLLRMPPSYLADIYSDINGLHFPTGHQEFAMLNFPLRHPYKSVLSMIIIQSIMPA